MENSKKDEKSQKISGKESTVQVSELQSWRTKRWLFGKRGRSRVSLKAQNMENPHLEKGRLYPCGIVPALR